MSRKRDGADDTPLYLAQSSPPISVDSAHIIGYQPARPNIFSRSVMPSRNEVLRPCGQVVISPSARQSSTRVLISSGFIVRPARTAPWHAKDARTDRTRASRLEALS